MSKYRALAILIFLFYVYLKNIGGGNLSIFHIKAYDKAQLYSSIKKLFVSHKASVTRQEKCSPSGSQDGRGLTLSLK